MTTHSWADLAKRRGAMSCTPPLLSESMAVLTETANDWWTAPPPRQVSYLQDIDPELISITLDALPPRAPLVLRFRPAGHACLGDMVDVLLDELDRAAIALFPRWLPGAERLEDSTQLGVPAVRALAAQTASRSSNFGPFLADLAERGLLGKTGGRSRFASEVRAAGLARVIMQAYGKHAAVVLVDVPVASHRGPKNRSSPRPSGSQIAPTSRSGWVARRCASSIACARWKSRCRST